MSRRNQMFVGLLAFSLGLAGGCKVGDQLEATLEAEPCTVEKDCWHSQECAQTIDEATLNLPGMCQPEGTGCVTGLQLGCDCNPADPSINCAYYAGSTALQATYPKMVCDPKILICVVAPPPEGGV